MRLRIKKPTYNLHTYNIANIPFVSGVKKNYKNKESISSSKALATDKSKCPSTDLISN